MGLIRKAFFFVKTPLFKKNSGALNVQPKWYPESLAIHAETVQHLIGSEWRRIIKTILKRKNFSTIILKTTSLRGNNSPQI